MCVLGFSDDYMAISRAGYSASHFVGSANTAALQVAVHWATLSPHYPTCGPSCGRGSRSIWTLWRRNSDGGRRTRAGSASTPRWRPAPPVKWPSCWNRCPLASTTSSPGLYRVMRTHRWWHSAARPHTPCGKRGMQPMLRCGTGRPADPVCWSGGAAGFSAPGWHAAGDRAWGAVPRPGHHGLPRQGQWGPTALVPADRFFCHCRTFLPPARLSIVAENTPCAGHHPLSLQRVHSVCIRYILN
jgi:hypothetical protein